MLLYTLSHITFICSFQTYMRTSAKEYLIHRQYNESVELASSSYLQSFVTTI